MAKIVGRDNLNRESAADRYLGYIPNNDRDRITGQQICQLMNFLYCRDDGGTYYTLEEDGYRLQGGMRDLVGEEDTGPMRDRVRAALGVPGMDRSPEDWDLIEQAARQYAEEHNP